MKIFLILLFLAFFTGACETLTEPGKDNQYGYDRILKDPAFGEGLLIYAYTSLPSSYAFDEVATDNAVSNDKSNSFLRMSTGEWSSQFNPLDSWATAYAAIYNLNYFLSVVDKVEWSYLSPLRNAYFIKCFKGQALALRGYFYSQLLVKYGGIAENDILLGVPLVTEALGINDEWKLPRNTYQQCIDQINSDFNLSLTMLPDKWADIPDSLDYNRVFGKININRINGEIVKGLKARMTLHAASPAFNNGIYDPVKCDSAASMAGELLVKKGGIAGLPADGVLFYDNDNDITNTDILWRNDYANSNTLESANYPPSLWGTGRVNPTQNLVDAFPMKNGYPITESGSGFNPAAPYALRDPRLTKYILTNGATLRSTIINTGIDSPTGDGLNKTANYSTRTGYYLLKFLRVNVNMNPASTSTARHFYTHMRWTEIYLNYAEAANEAWGPTGDPKGYGFTAKSIIAAIRNRAGVTPTTDLYLASLTTKDQMRDMIRNERRLELCFEGVRFWDLRRWNLNLNETAKGVSINAGVYTPIEVENRIYPSYGIYGPIPLQEILKFSGLIQNKGW